MPTVIEGNQLSAGYRLFIYFSCAKRNNLVLFAPHKKGGQANHVLQQRGEVWIEHVGSPSESRGFRTGVFPCFKLFRSLFSTVEFSKFWSALSILHAGVEIGFRGHNE